MNTQLQQLRDRIVLLEQAVGEIRERLVNCLAAAGQPKDALALARGVAETVTKRVLENIGLKPPAMLDACLRELEDPKVMSRGLVPAEIITLLHMTRVLGNKATHDALRIDVTASDVDLVLRSVLRVIEWYFGEFERGPKVTPLFKAAPPPLCTDEPPPGVRLPPLVCLLRGPGQLERKVFVFTERLLGLGRQKPSRDSRVHIVTRLLPSPDASHPNWNLNLQQISQFHAQVWWQMGRVEVRDEASDKGVLLNGRLIAPGVWTLCSFSDPARIQLGPGGVEFTVSEQLRNISGNVVSAVRLARIGNSPTHEYLLVSRPLINVGSALDNLVYSEHLPTHTAYIRCEESGWLVDGPLGETILQMGRTEYQHHDQLCIRHAREEDFMT